MAMKCCTKLETAKERCPIAFQGHPSNFKVTRDKTSPILTQIGRFRTIGRSQLSNPSDLPCYAIFSAFSEKICGLGTVHSTRIFKVGNFDTLSSCSQYIHIVFNEKGVHDSLRRWCSIPFIENLICKYWVRSRFYFFDCDKSLAFPNFINKTEVLRTRLFRLCFHGHSCECCQYVFPEAQINC